MRVKLGFDVFGIVTGYGQFSALIYNIVSPCLGNIRTFYVNIIDAYIYNGPLVKTTLKIFKRVMQYWQKLHNELRWEPCSLVIYESGLYYSLVHSHLSVAAVPGAKYIHSDI